MANKRLSIKNCIYADSSYLIKYTEYETIKSKSSKTGLFVFAYSLTMYLLSYIMVFLLKQLCYGSPVFADTYKTASYLLDIFISVFAVLIPALIFVKLSKSSFSELIPVRYIRQKYVIPLIMLGMGTAMLANVATGIVADNFSLFGIQNTVSAVSSSKTDGAVNIILNIVSTAVVPAFAEEFAFRGVVLGSLRKYGDSLAIIGSSILFGAMHQNISQIPFAFILGLILAFATCKFNSVLPSIAIHFTNNLYAVVMSILKSQNIISDSLYSMISYGLVIIFCITGLISYVILARKDKDIFKISENTLNKQKEILSLSEKMTAFLANPGIILSLVLFIVMTVANLGFING